MLDEFNDEFLKMEDTAKHFSTSELHIKASNGDLHGIMEIMRDGYNPMDKDKYGNCALHYAAREGHLHILKYFIDELGFNPTVTGANNYTPLHHSILKCHLPVVQYLLWDKDIEALCYSDNKITPLHLACYRGHIDIAMELIKNVSTYLHGDYNVLHASVDNTTPLHLAASRGQLNVIKYLTMEIKCDPMARDSYGNTLVHAAAFYGHLHIIKFFVSYFSWCGLVNKAVLLYANVWGCGLVIKTVLRC